jgi:hypothetical protein
MNAAADIKQSELVKIHLMKLLHTGNASTPELTQALRAEGLRVQNTDVCNHLATLKKWGWTRVTEKKSMKLGNRPGSVPVNVWTARHEIPTVEDVREARGGKRGSRSQS